MCLSVAEDIMVAVCRETFAPPARLPIDQWADAYRQIPEYGARKGRWRTDFAEYLREPMQCASDDSIHDVTLMWGSQLGKTEIYTNCLMAWADQDPGPMLAVFPSRELSLAYSTERFKPSILATPRVLSRLRGGLGNEREIKGQSVNFDRCTLHTVGSNSQSHLEMRSVRRLVLDETDAEEFYEPAIPWALERLKAFYGRHKVLAASKPSFSGRGIHERYLRGDRRTYWVPCPHCGTFQRLRWQQVKWEGGHTAAPEDVEREAWYECEHPPCKRRIENHHKAMMVRRGRWAREGCEVIAGADGQAVVIGEAKHPTEHHASFQLSSLYSMVLPFGYVARVFLENGAVATRGWVNGELGEPWSPTADKIEVHELRSICAGLGAGGYLLVRPGLGPRGGAKGGARVPVEVLGLSGGIDLQKDSAVVAVWGHTERGLDSYLIWHDVVPCPQSGPKGLGVLDRLVGVNSLLFAWEGSAAPGAEVSGLPVTLWAIDSGEGRRTIEVYQWAMRFSHVWASKGRDELPFGMPHQAKLAPYDPDAPERPMKLAAGEPVKASVRHLVINTTAWKDRLFAGLRRRREELTGGRVRVAAAPMGEAGWGGGRIHLPADCGDEFLRQLASEELGPKGPRTSRAPGSPQKFAWRLRAGHHDNHFLDASVMALAVADARGVRTMVKAKAVGIPNGQMAKGQMATSEPETGAKGARIARRDGGVDLEAWGGLKG